MGIAASRDVATNDPFEALFDEEWRSMLQLAYLITGSHAIAEEIVQESMAVVLKRWETIASPGGYLRTTVVRSAARHKRRRKREGEYVASLPTTTIELPQHDDIWDHLTELNARQRAAIILRFYADLSMDDIATTLGCRPATARSLVRRGLEQLRKQVVR